MTGVATRLGSGTKWPAAPTVSYHRCCIRYAGGAQNVPRLRANVMTCCLLHSNRVVGLTLRLGCGRSDVLSLPGLAFMDIAEFVDYEEALDFEHNSAAVYASRSSALQCAVGWVSSHRLADACGFSWEGAA